ncbi:RNA-binding protein [Rhodobaculum claviforme]|uniref:RNA-binding protein n=2 Tax=Rhodobaculum claviforme TaxID=1549854 RepID=A0A934TJE9_9RHOB|nr:RNA-binding S4 domain-containing protein [Rhodobaculum claviforme]MBK5926723.1 RNA-binding protein [Rhodobaculum claviforme]
MRLDKWLWHARFFKTRALAARVVAGGKVRINGRRVTKPATTVAVGAVLTFVVSDRARVIRVAAFDVRRGPATQARTLYEDLTPGPSGGVETPESPLD